MLWFAERVWSDSRVFSTINDIVDLTARWSQPLGWYWMAIKAKQEP